MPIFLNAEAGGGLNEITVDFTTNLNTIMNKVTDVFAVSKITDLITTIVTVGAPYALLYWGARKALRAVFSAVKRGKVRF